ncbi:MAG: hypothetical protein IPO40_24820 [Fibrobacteres bacterium]|nr:hypothetical protein [Fibrobacterota bacterium]
MADRKFNPIEEWDEDDGDCLFFKLDAGEPPTVANPLDSDWEDGYYTHFMLLPNELRRIEDYVAACRESGIVSEFDRSAESGKAREVDG